MIEYWKQELSLQSWDITTQRISSSQVVFPIDLLENDRYYVGIYPDHKKKTAVIYHDRDLIEEDIVHELLHVAFPEMSEEKISKYTSVILNIKKT